MKKPTIKDVAKLAKVSPATVSRTLQQPNIVAEETRKRIFKAIKQLNYQTNGIAQTLRRRKSHIILVVVPNIKNPFFARVFEGIHQCAKQENYTIFLANTDGNEAQEEAYIRQLLKGWVDGIILLNGRISPNIQEQVELSQLPIVFACEFNKNTSFLPVVRTNNLKASMELVDLLIKNGHKNIAYVNGPKENSLAKERYKGYLQSLKKAQIQYKKEYYYQGDYSLRSGIKSAQYYLSLKKRPSAVFCANDEMALGLMSELKKNDIKIPEDISIVGFDDIDFSATSFPSLTTIRQDAETIGYKATEILFKRMNNQKIKKPSAPIDIPHRLIERETVNRA